jgi:hypothetical protein
MKSNQIVMAIAGSAALGGVTFGPVGAAIGAGVAVVGIFGATLVTNSLKSTPVTAPVHPEVIKQVVVKGSFNPAIQSPANEFSDGLTQSPVVSQPTTFKPLLQSPLNNTVAVNSSTVVNEFCDVASKPVIAPVTPVSYEAAAKDFAIRIAAGLRPIVSRAQDLFKATTGFIGQTPVIGQSLESGLNSIGSHAKKAALHTVQDSQKLGANLVVSLVVNSIANLYNNGLRGSLRIKNLLGTGFNTVKAVAFMGAVDYAKQAFLPVATKTAIASAKQTISAYTNPMVADVAEGALELGVTYAGSYVLGKTLNAAAAVAKAPFNFMSNLFSKKAAPVVTEKAAVVTNTTKADTAEMKGVKALTEKLEQAVVQHTVDGAKRPVALGSGTMHFAYNKTNASTPATVVAQAPVVQISTVRAGANL